MFQCDTRGYTSSSPGYCHCEECSDGCGVGVGVGWVWGRGLGVNGAEELG